MAGPSDRVLYLRAVAGGLTREGRDTEAQAVFAAAEAIDALRAELIAVYRSIGNDLRAHELENGNG